MKYFYENEKNEQVGPIGFEKLNSTKLKSSTLIWKEGMEDWSEAKNFEELSHLFFQPPPLPNNRNQINVNKDLDIKTENLKKSSLLSPKGRMRRSEYFGYLFIFGLIIAGLNGLADSGFVDNISDDNLFYILALVAILGFLVLLYLYIIIIIKRLHDMNFYGWLFFIGFIPVINLILLFWDGIEGQNKYGADPKGRKSRN